MVDHRQISYETPHFVELVGADGLKPALPTAVMSRRHNVPLRGLDRPGAAALSLKYAGVTQW